MAGNQKGPEERLATLKGVVDQLRIGPFIDPVREALGEVEAVIAVIPTPEPGVTPAQVSEARRAALEAIDAAWVVLNRQQWAWCVEETIRQQRRLEDLASAKHSEPRRNYFPPLLRAWEEASRGVGRAMKFQGESREFAELCRANHRNVGKAWRIFKEIRDRGGLKASEVFGPDGVGAKLDEVKVTIEVLVYLTDTEITDLGLSEDDLTVIRRRIPIPEES